MIPEISHKQRASDEDWAEEEAEDQESTGSESGSSGGSSRSSLAKTLKIIAGVQSLEDIHRDQLALQELRQALIPAETLGTVPIHDTPTPDHGIADRRAMKEQADPSCCWLLVPISHGSLTLSARVSMFGRPFLARDGFREMFKLLTVKAAT